MPSRRTARAAEAIRETVSMAVLFGLRDPRIQNVTVLSAEVSGDLRHAKVYVSVMGDMKRQALTMKGLDAARGFIQSKVADRLQTKHTPVLEFVLDQGVKKSIEASRILRDSLPLAPSAENATGGTPAADDAPATIAADDADMDADDQEIDADLENPADRDEEAGGSGSPRRDDESAKN